MASSTANMVAVNQDFIQETFDVVGLSVGPTLNYRLDVTYDVTYDEYLHQYLHETSWPLQSCTSGVVAAFFLS
jgi:hypothetical protein